jgi:hypothetical protein
VEQNLSLRTSIKKLFTTFGLEPLVIIPLYHFSWRTDAPRITSGPRDQRVVDNGVASFLCRATGNPMPEIQWRRTSGGRRATYTVTGGGSAGGMSSSGGGGSGRQQSRYTVIAMPASAHSTAASATVGSVLRVEPVKAAKGDDDSEIECVADNGIGEPAVASARLVVYLIDGHSTEIIRTSVTVAILSVLSVRRSASPTKYQPHNWKFVRSFNRCVIHLSVVMLPIGCRQNANFNAAFVLRHKLYRRCCRIFVTRIFHHYSCMEHVDS